MVGDEDDNEIDTGEFEIHSKDIPEYIELFIFKKDGMIVPIP